MTDKRYDVVRYDAMNDILYDMRDGMRYSMT